MRRITTFLAGLAAGAVLGITVSAWAGWNEQPGTIGPDRGLLERITRSSEESARRLGELAATSRDSVREQGEIVRALADIARQKR